MDLQNYFLAAGPPQPFAQNAYDLYESIWKSLPMFYQDGHLHTTVLMIFPDGIDTVNLEASHLSPEFPMRVASGIQNIRLDRPTMEGFAIAHEVLIESENENKTMQLFISDVSNGVALFFRHRNIPDTLLRVAYAKIGDKQLVVYSPHEIAVPEEGSILALSFDLNFLQQ